MGLFVIGLVFSKDSGWGSGVLAASAVTLALLPLLQSRGRAVVDVYTHRGITLVYVVSFALITAAALVLHVLYSWTWLTYGAAMLALILTLVMGPAMDARL